VQGVLAARIDRLAPDEKALLQQLAVIGREFPLSLIRQVIPQPEEELYRLLSSLQHKEFLYEQPAFPEVEYFFKHALTQEVAYNSVLIERRKVLHEQTAQVIEQLFRDRVEEHYDELAYHYQRSGNIGKAIEYLHKAGQQAAQKSAHMEAITCLTSALELLKAFPDTSERAQQELSLQLALSASLATVRGPGSQEAGDIYIRAQALCNQLGETPQLLPVLRGLCSFHMARAEVRAAREIGEQLFTLAQKLQDMPFLIEAHRTLAEALFFLGELIHARSYFEKGASLSELQQRQLGSLFHRGDPGVACRARVARVLWALGYPDQALVRSQEALALAQDLSDPKIIAYALYDAGAVHHFRREGPKLQERGEALVALAREQDFSFDLASGHVLCGLATIEYGQEAEGVEQMRQGLSALQVTGAILPWTVWSAPLAEACWKIGLTEEGMSVINETLALAEKTGGRAYEAELYRVKGELTLQKFQASLRQASSKFQASQDQSEDTDPRPPNPAPQGEAEACFLKAIEIARAQQAKSLELRAVMSLVRLRQRQASEEGSRNTHYASRIRLAEAHTMLSEIYNWFTEGFDTKDLQEAKGLLEELSL
jgi:tetratricopeptide (TPR) repeat protein